MAASMKIIFLFLAILANSLISNGLLQSEVEDRRSIRDGFRLILSDINEKKVKEEVDDFTQYKCEKMVVIRNKAEAEFKLTCKIPLFLFVTVTTCVSAIPFSPLEYDEPIPPFGIPSFEPAEEEAKELDIEKVAKALELDKSWPFAKKEISFEKGFDFGLGAAGAAKELELEKEFSSKAGVERGIGYAKTFPWALYEKYFGVGKKLTFEQALVFELYKSYGYYGVWVARELQRRFAIAKQLGLVGKEVAFQEAIGLGLFKGIGLETIFEKVNKAIGAEKTLEFEKEFGIYKKFF